MPPTLKTTRTLQLRFSTAICCHPKASTNVVTIFSYSYTRATYRGQQARIVICHDTSARGEPSDTSRAADPVRQGMTEEWAARQGSKWPFSLHIGFRADDDRGAPRTTQHSTTNRRLCCVHLTEERNDQSEMIPRERLVGVSMTGQRPYRTCGHDALLRRLLRAPILAVPRTGWLQREPEANDTVAPGRKGGSADSDASPRRRCCCCCSGVDHDQDTVWWASREGWGDAVRCAAGGGDVSSSWPRNSGGGAPSGRPSGPVGAMRARTGRTWVVQYVVRRQPQLLAAECRERQSGQGSMSPSHRTERRLYSRGPSSCPGSSGVGPVQFLSGDFCWAINCSRSRAGVFLSECNAGQGCP